MQWRKPAADRVGYLRIDVADSAFHNDRDPLKSPLFPLTIDSRNPIRFRLCQAAFIKNYGEPWATA